MSREIQQELPNENVSKAHLIPDQGKVNMEETRFWSIIDKSKRVASENAAIPTIDVDKDNIDIFYHWKLQEKITKYQKEQNKALKNILYNLSEQELILFKAIFYEYLNESHLNYLREAAYIINDSCSNDDFIDFKEWLISQGKDAYFKALNNPETLIEIAIPLETAFGSFEGRAGEVYEERFNKNIPNITRRYPTKIIINEDLEKIDQDEWDDRNHEIYENLYRWRKTYPICSGDLLKMYLMKPPSEEKELFAAFSDAVIVNNEEVVRYILDQNKEAVNSSQFLVQLSLVDAIIRGYNDIVKLIITHPNVKDKIIIYNKTIAHNYIFSWSDILTPLLAAARYGRVEILKFLLEILLEIVLENGCSENKLTSCEYYAAIITAMQHGHPEIVKLLEQYKNLKGNDYLNYIHNLSIEKVMYACLHDNTEAVEILLNLRDIEGNTVFMLACKEGKIKLIRDFLLSKNINKYINLEITNNNGDTAEELASKFYCGKKIFSELRKNHKKKLAVRSAVANEINKDQIESQDVAIIN